ncbi:hypothetical protein AGMMS49525_14410 [Bacteroidia bacterium]|nr:hypothetical protein AGMMS49525_14410 [Bacteroidia bacterium]
MLTLGLDGAEIVFSIPTVTEFNTLAEVEVPLIFKCGEPIKGYTTANYNNPGLEDLCWTTQNIAEGVATYDTYIDMTGAIVPPPTKGERGYYYEQSQADAACKALGLEWSVPAQSQWYALVTAFGALTPGAGTTGSVPTLQIPWTANAALGGHIVAIVPAGSDWGDRSLWWIGDVTDEAMGIDGKMYYMDGDDAGPW